MRKGKGKPDYLARYENSAKYHKYTFKVSKNRIQKLSPQQKGAITKAWKKQKDFKTFIAEDNRQGSESYKFVKASPGQLKKLKKQFPNQTTNKGVFIKFPRLRTKKVEKVSVNQQGETTVKIGNRTQVFIPLSQKEYARNPEAAIAGKLRGRPKPDSIAFSVEGYTTDRQRTPEAFFFSLGTGYIQTMKDEFQREADKRNNEVPRFTGIVLTYYGDRRKRVKVTTKWIQKYADRDYTDENEPF